MTEVLTFGCRLNIAESEAMRMLAAGQDDLVIVNSCAVTAQAVREARRAIRRVRRARPEARIVVTGCAAQIEPATFAAMPEVARIVGNGDKLRAETWQTATPSSPRTCPGVHGAALPETVDFTAGWMPKQVRHVGFDPSRHTRAFVPVQNGCDHRCTFCIIPQGRGASRSEPPTHAIDAISALVEAGQREVVLTGVDLTSYGADLPGTSTLGDLVAHILRAVPELPRLRLSSLDSAEIDDRLFDLMTGEPRVMPHLHLSLQSGDDLILKRMKRRHSAAQAIATVRRLKAARPEIAIGADLIAGFPTEDAAAHARSLAHLEECDIVFGHIFPYSPRAGTPAARMPQIAPEVARARAAALREAAAARKAAWLAGLIGTTQEVLVERCGTKGHAPNFAEVRLDPAPNAVSERFRHGLAHPPVRPELVEGLSLSSMKKSRASTGSARTERCDSNAHDVATSGRILPLRITAATPTHLIGAPL